MRNNTQDNFPGSNLWFCWRNRFCLVQRLVEINFVKIASERRMDVIQALAIYINWSTDNATAQSQRGLVWWHGARCEANPKEKLKINVSLLLRWALCGVCIKSSQINKRLHCIYLWSLAEMPTDCTKTQRHMCRIQRQQERGFDVIVCGEINSSVECSILSQKLSQQMNKTKCPNCGFGFFYISMEKQGKRLFLISAFLCISIIWFVCLALVFDFSIATPRQVPTPYSSEVRWKPSTCQYQ